MPALAIRFLTTRATCRVGLKSKFAPRVFSITILDLTPTPFGFNRELFYLNRERTAAKSSFAISRLKQDKCGTRGMPFALARAASTKVISRCSRTESSVTFRSRHLDFSSRFNANLVSTVHVLRHITKLGMQNSRFKPYATPTEIMTDTGAYWDVLLVFSRLLGSRSARGSRIWVIPVFGGESSMPTTAR